MKPKDIRKQMRNVVQEIMPEILANETHAVEYAKLKKEMDERLERIEKYVKEQLGQVNDRTKDMQAFLIRHAASSAPAGGEKV